MSIKSLGDPFDDNADLTHKISCTCESCTVGAKVTDKERTTLLEKQAEKMVSVDTPATESKVDEVNVPESSDDHFDRAIESAFVRGIFGHNDASRRKFLKKRISFYTGPALLWLQSEMLSGGEKRLQNLMVYMALPSLQRGRLKRLLTVKLYWTVLSRFLTMLSLSFSETLIL